MDASRLERLRHARQEYADLAKALVKDASDAIDRAAFAVARAETARVRSTRLILICATGRGRASGGADPGREVSRPVCGPDAIHGPRPAVAFIAPARGPAGKPVPQGAGTGTGRNWDTVGAGIGTGQEQGRRS
jgi:hypothetical protein